MSTVYAPRLMRPCPQTNGYLRVTLLSSDGKQSTKTVHKLVMETFVGPRPKDEEIRHLDGNKTHNTLTNLKYGTKSENAQDRVQHGNDAHLRRTHCPQGHEYNEENTSIRKLTGWRNCLPCGRETHRKSYAARHGKSVTIV